MADLRIQRIGAPTKGLWTNTSHDVPKGYAPVFHNFLPGRPNYAPVRGSVRAHQSGSYHTTNAFLTGLAPFGLRYLEGFGVAGTMTVTKSLLGLDFSNLAALTNLQLFSVDPAVNFLATNVAASVATAENMPGRRSTFIGSNLYIQSASSASTVVINGITRRLTNVLRASGVSAYPTVHVNAPRGFVDLRAFTNRLFVAGGCPADTPTANPSPNALYWSDPVGATGAALPDTAAAWQDDVSGLINRIVVESDDQNDMIIGLAKCAAGLVIFKTRSTHVLYGSGPSNYVVKQIASNIGCISRESIVEISNGVAFMSEKGYMFFDGAQFELLSEPVNTELVANAYSVTGWPATAAGHVSAAKMPGDYIIIAMADFTTAGVVTGSVRVNYIVHVPSKTWATFSPTPNGGGGQPGSSGSGSPFLFVGAGSNGGNFTLAADERSVYELSFVSQPEAADVEVGANTAGRMGADAYNLIGIQTRAFQANIILPPMPLGSDAGYASQLIRAIVNWRAATTTGSPPATAFTVNLRDTEQANTIIDTWNLPFDATANVALGQWRRQRMVQGTKYEVGDLIVEISYPGTTDAAINKMYFYDFSVEVARARNLPSGW